MSIQRQRMEVAVAAVLATFSGAVMLGSLQLAHGWGATGPESGYFPLRLGALLMIVSVLLLVQAVRKPVDGAFATGEQLRRTASMFIPTALLVLAMPFTGLYVAACVYLVYMARTHGKFPWWKSLLLGVGSTAVFFGVFELWFGVPLVKGPLETWLGY
jgi:hypothetical protein